MGAVHFDFRKIYQGLYSVDVGLCCGSDGGQMVMISAPPA